MLAALALGGLSGCGSSDGDSGACTVVAPTAKGRTEVTVEAKAMAFTTSCLQVQPGTLVVTFENRDKGVPHNFRVKGHGVNDATDLKAGPDTQTLTVDLTETGTYQFLCDPHANMRGKIVVAEAALGATSTTA